MFTGTCMCSGSAKQMMKHEIMALSLMVRGGNTSLLTFVFASLSGVFGPSSAMSYLFDSLLITFKLPVRLLGEQNELSPYFFF